MIIPFKAKREAYTASSDKAEHLAQSPLIGIIIIEYTEFKNIFKERQGIAVFLKH